jgi:Zn finger protein HypA/HybF involved in hydrogenase expression
MLIKLNKLECKRCKYNWLPRKQEIRQCPKCKTAYWDIAKGEDNANKFSK